MALREAHEKSKYRGKLGISSSSRRVRVESEESSHDGDLSHSTNHDEAHLDGSSGELKQLQDSLTRYYTPSNRRRSRVAQSSFSIEQLDDSSLHDNDKHREHRLRNEDSDEGRTTSKYEVKHEDGWQVNGVERKRVTRKEQMCPLTVSVDEAVRCEGPSSGSRIVQSPYTSWKSSHLAHSPHKRNDVLFDALSPYFSASSEKRRTFSKGEYAQLSGVRRRGRSGDSTSTQEQISPASAWSVERARTSPEHSSCESLAQAESSGQHEHLEADESSILDRSMNGTVHESSRRRRLGLASASSGTAANECDGESEETLKDRRHHKTINNNKTPTRQHLDRSRLSLSVRAQSDAAEESTLFSPKRLRSSLPRRDRTPSPKQTRRERAPSAKRIRTPKLPHTPTTSPDAHSSGGSNTSYTLRTATRAHLRREATSRKRASAACLVRKAKSRSIVNAASQRHNMHNNANLSRLKSLRSVPSTGHNLRHAVAGPSAQPGGELRKAAVRRLSSPHKVKHVESLAYEKPVDPTESDKEMYECVCVLARKKVEESSGGRRGSTEEPGEESAGRLRRIVLGGYEMETWYSAPYPQEYSRLTSLYMCEFCMLYMKTEHAFRRHLVKCSLRYPPGTEIYRKDNVSVFEVDGNVSVTYCQNVCLLSKLFLDHKTLYYDVEPFLFYVLTRNDDHGFHFVGYFSKEKYSAQKYNLSCIMTLPCYQMQGFGRFLIDFSFLLSRREGMMGTPERPLSDLGRISYLNYWLSAILEHLHQTLDSQHPKKITIKSIARATGISIFDIVEAIEPLGMVQREDAQNVLFVNWTLVEKHWKKATSNPRRLWIDESVLEWVPKEYTPYSPSKEARLRSPGAPSLSPNRQASIRGDSRSPRVTHNPHDKKNGVKRKFQSTSRKRLVFDNKRCGPKRPKRGQATGSDESSHEEEDVMRASPTSKNSCKDESRGRRSRHDPSDDDKSSSADDHDDEPFRAGKYRSPQKSNETRSSRRRRDSVRHVAERGARTATLTRQSRARARRALIERSSSSETDSEDANVPLPSKRSPQKRRKRLPRKRIQPKVKTPSRDSSVDTVETVAMLDGEEEDLTRKLDSVMVVSSPTLEKQRKTRERSSGAEGSTEAERWAESIGVSSSSPSLSCPYTPPAVSNGSAATEKSFDHMAMADEQDGDVTLNAEHEEDRVRDREDRTSLSRCDVEVAASNDDELPPTLEADGDMPPLWHRSPVDSPEPVVMEVSFTASEHKLSSTAGTSGEGSHSRTEMPQLRASAAGTDSLYDGEDEDAPPRLSPNFAPMEVAEEGSVSESETTPPWAESTVTGSAERVASQNKETVDSSPPRLARSTCAATPPKPLLRTTSTTNNTCEMVNLGGDAGSEGDTSESEGVQNAAPRTRSDSGPRTVCEVATLDAEPSALDRPPKAPAMLTQPEEHEGSGSFTDGHNSFAKKRTQPPATGTMYGQAPSNGSERSPIATVTTPLTGSAVPVSSQHFISSPSCSLQKHTPTGSHQMATPHPPAEMCQASPGSSVYLGTSTAEGPALHPSPTPTPLRITTQPQQQAHEPSSFGSPTLSKCDTDPMMQQQQQQSSNTRTMVASTVPSSSSCKTTPAPVAAPPLPQPSHQQSAQRRGSVKKELGRCAKQQQQQTTQQQQQSTGGSLMIAPRGGVQATAPTTAVAPYMLPSPASHAPISHQLPSHTQPPAGYYQGNYGPAGGGSEAHFESQFYRGSFSSGGSTTGSYAGTASGSYPMNMASMAKSHSVSAAAAAAMHNTFSPYNYQSGMQPGRGGMLGAGGAQAPAQTGGSAGGSSQSMMGGQCAAVQNGNAAATASSAPWRYGANGGSAPFSGGGFMEFGVPPGGNGQFLSNQIYPQPYYPYLMPVMRND